MHIHVRAVRFVLCSFATCDLIPIRNLRCSLATCDVYFPITPRTMCTKAPYAP